MRSTPFLTALAALCFAAGAAHAVLGEPVAASAATGASVGAKPSASAAGRMRALGAGVQVVETSSADGGVIREYVAPSGVVFAVSWSTRFKPRLDQLLGRYHAGYAAAAHEAASRPGMRRAAVLRADDLVVQSGGRMNAFTGRAWVPSLTPAGFDSAAVR